MRSPEQLARAVVVAGMQRLRPERLRYGWSAGIWLRGLVAWSDVIDIDVLSYLRCVYRVWSHAPPVTAADQALPGGVAAALERRMRFPEGHPALERTVDYLSCEPLNDAGTFDHVGPRNPLRRWMRWGEHVRFTVGPGSLWADSMMMYVWPAQQIALLTGEARWSRLALAHAKAFVSTLRLPSGLFAHARGDELFPRDGSVWLRAHGWMLAVLADLLAEEPDARDTALREGFGRALRATWDQRGRDDLWPNVIAPALGESAPELSGNALVLYALARAPSSLCSREMVERSWSALCSRFVSVDGAGEPSLLGTTHSTPVRWVGRDYERGLYAAWSRFQPGTPAHAFGTLLLAARAVAARR